MSVLINNNGTLNPIAGNGIQNTFTGTEAEVTAAMAAGEIAEGTVVYITDDNGVGVNAEDIAYDNTTSGLTANDVQDAIDEIKSDLTNKADKATTLAGYGITDAQTKLTNPLTQADVINNLSSSTTNKPLSAAQGKAINDRFVFNTLIESNGSAAVTIKSNKVYLVCSHGLGDKYTIGVLSTTYNIHFTVIKNDGSDYLNWTCSGNNATFVNLDSNTVSLSITEM